VDSHGERSGSPDSNCRLTSAFSGESREDQSHFADSGVERFEAESGREYLIDSQEYVAWIAGVDGCPAGWFVVLVELGSSTRREEHRVCASFSEVLGLEPEPSIIAVDIPIGLLDEPREGGRGVDKQARRLLGTPRRSSVFTPPTRPALISATYEEAQSFGAGMSHQAFGILPKIREVDQLMTPEVQETVREIHPELCSFATPL
jgi:predicted RNase H-like nuclease